MPICQVFKQEIQKNNNSVLMLVLSFSTGIGAAHFRPRVVEMRCASSADHSEAGLETTLLQRTRQKISPEAVDKIMRQKVYFYSLGDLLQALKTQANVVGERRAGAL